MQEKHQNVLFEIERNLKPLKKNSWTTKNKQKNCIGTTIRIGQEIQCLPYAGCFVKVSQKNKQKKKRQIYKGLTGEETKEKNKFSPFNKCWFFFCKQYF